MSTRLVVGASPKTLDGGWESLDVIEQEEWNILKDLQSDPRTAPVPILGLTGRHSEQALAGKNIAGVLPDPPADKERLRSLLHKLGGQ